MCCLGWAVCGGILPQGSVADFCDSREDAKPCCHTILLLTDPGGIGQTGNILQPLRPRKFQVSWSLYSVLLYFALKLQYYCLVPTHTYLWVLCHPQWHRLDWVSEQHWQFRRHSDPLKRRRHEGGTASLAQIWGKEWVLHTYWTNIYCTWLTCVVIQEPTSTYI